MGLLVPGSPPGWAQGSRLRHLSSLPYKHPVDCWSRWYKQRLHTADVLFGVIELTLKKNTTGISMYVVHMYLFLGGLSVVCTNHMEQLVLEKFVSGACGNSEFLTGR